MTGKQKKIKKPNRIIYFILYHLISLFLRIKCKATFDRSGLEGLKGPALVLCPAYFQYGFPSGGRGSLSPEAYIRSEQALSGKAGNPAGF